MSVSMAFSRVFCFDFVLGLGFHSAGAADAATTCTPDVRLASAGVLRDLREMSFASRHATLSVGPVLVG